jgi:BirA family biotin operon repressor/biotin-[acetyl-CoA-carboxylase] ligase
MINFRIEHLEETSSTNSLVLERARHGEPEGLVIVAGHQTSGRGKPGRKWESPRGKNLLFSVLLRPPMKPAGAPLLTQVACRTVAKVLEAKYDIPSTFKRPNDVMVNGKKICGILTEAISSGNRLEAVVIGIGLDVNAETEEIPPEAVSMKVLRGITYVLPDVLNGILAELNRNLKDLYKKRKSWGNACLPLT